MPCGSRRFLTWNPSSTWWIPSTPTSSIESTTRSTSTRHTSSTRLLPALHRICASLACSSASPGKSTRWISSLQQEAQWVRSTWPTAWMAATTIATMHVPRSQCQRDPVATGPTPSTTLLPRESGSTRLSIAAVLASVLPSSTSDMIMIYFSSIHPSYHYIFIPMSMLMSVCDLPIIIDS